MLSDGLKKCSKLATMFDSSKWFEGLLEDSQEGDLAKSQSRFAWLA